MCQAKVRRSLMAISFLEPSLPLSSGTVTKALTGNEISIMASSVCMLWPAVNKCFITHEKSFRLFSTLIKRGKQSPSSPNGLLLKFFRVPRYHRWTARSL